MPAEPITATSPRLLSLPWLTQRWRHVAFVHWAVQASAVARFMPPGVAVDTIDGVTHVGLIGFRMVRAGAFGAGVPILGSFWETNVRLYSVDGEGRRGVVFVTLDASRLLAVLGARVGFGLPYVWSRMSVRRDGDRVAYRSDRILFGPRPAHSELVVEIGERIAAPTPLEHWLTARWGLHAERRGRGVYLPNDHPAWTLHRAGLVRVDPGAVTAVGISPPATPSSVLYSPGVAVRFGRALPVES